MNRIEELFQNRKQNILSVYFTAGYPELSDTLRIIRGLDEAGADMIEIGMPFSDPIADGPVIQRSSEKALRNGMTIKLLFEQLKGIRGITELPLILMGYINPVLKFGMQNFITKCKETGIDGVILPDLPPEEFRKSYEKLFRKHEIFNIFLISPDTPDERIIYLDSFSKGFLYMVSTSATTGAKEIFDNSQIAYFKRVNDLNLKTPRLTGFGISNRATFTQACQYSEGVIIGSAFIRTLSDSGDLTEDIREFLLTLLPGK